MKCVCVCVGQGSRGKEITPRFHNYELHLIVYG